MNNATQMTFILNDKNLINLVSQIGYFITINCAISAAIGAVMPMIIKFFREKSYKKKPFNGLG